MARRCINHVITSYGSKCAEAEEYDRVRGRALSCDPQTRTALAMSTKLPGSCLTALLGVQQAQEAVISRISYKERGSQSNWPDSHLPYVSTLNRLVEENSSLKDKVKNGAEYRFYAGIFNQLNKHLQQGGNNDFEYQRKWHELKQFQASLYSQNPAAFDRLMLGQTLDAQSRRLDYEVFLRHCQERRMHDQTQQCNLVSADKAADFTKQVTELQKSMNILSQENLDLKSAVNSMKQPLQSLKVCYSVINTTALQHRRL